MKLKNFIKDNRAMLDAAIFHVCPNLAPLTDSDRREWILNDESLYKWARAEGCKNI